MSPELVRRLFVRLERANAPKPFAVCLGILFRVAFRSRRSQPLAPLPRSAGNAVLATSASWPALLRHGRVLLAAAALASLGLGLDSAQAGVAELERLRAAVRAAQYRPENLSPAKLLEGLRPEQRREALYLLSLVPARRARLDEILEPLSEGQDEYADRAVLERLQLALYSGDIRAASALAEAFRIAHTESPALPKVLLLVATGHLDSGDTPRASEGFLQVLLRYPASEEARLAQIGLGDCYVAEGKLKQAQAQYELAVKNAGDASECLARLRLADTARRMKDDKAAASAVKSLLEACPEGLIAEEARKRWPELVPGPTPLPTPVPVAARTTPGAGATPGTKPTATAPTGPEAYWIQIGAYSERANAERLLGRLDAERSSIRIDDVVLSGRTIYKVLYGPFGTEAEATDAAQKLEQKHNLFGFVVRKAG